MGRPKKTYPLGSVEQENHYFCLKITTHKERFCQIIPNFVTLQV